MNPYAFLSAIQSSELRRAIARAERQTSGEIRVLVIHDPAPDPVAAAHARFRALRMHTTKRRNAILLFVAPASQTFAIVGDVGVHAVCGDDFWTSVRDAMADHLKKRNYAEALLLGIQKAGALLAEHFPPDDHNPNELPNTILQE